VLVELLIYERLADDYENLKFNIAALQNLMTVWYIVQLNTIQIQSHLKYLNLK